MTYVDVICRCCKGKWRARMQIPRADQRYIAILDVDAICGRCNNGDCSRPPDDLPSKIGCNEGRRRAR